jgi:hypothetical protein
LNVRFLADANFNQKIVAGLLLREPEIDFELPQDVIPEGMNDPKVLELGAALGRVIVTHDVRTMPRHFSAFVADQTCSGLILRTHGHVNRGCNRRTAVDLARFRSCRMDQSDAATSAVLQNSQ